MTMLQYYNIRWR